MGAIRFSTDPRLLAELKTLLGIRVFVETGTYEGDSTAVAASLIDQVHTIELSPEHYVRAAERFAGDEHVEVLHGGAEDLLPVLFRKLRKRATVFWLDAHWCEADAAGAESQCPLLDELAAITPLNEKSVVLIDDARLFFAPPPRPAEAEQWPTFDELLSAMPGLGTTHRLMVLDDVFVLFPASIEEPLRAWARDNTTDWHAELQSGRRIKGTLDSVLANVEKARTSAEKARTNLKEREERQFARVNKRMDKLGLDIQRLAEGDQAARIAPQLTSLSEELSTLQASVADLELKVGSSSESVRALTEQTKPVAALDERLEALAEKVAGVESNLTDGMGAADARLAERLDSSDARTAERLESSDAQMAARLESSDERMAERLDAERAALAAGLEALSKAQEESKAEITRRIERAEEARAEASKALAEGFAKDLAGTEDRVAELEALRAPIAEIQQTVLALSERELARERRQAGTFRRRLAMYRSRTRLEPRLGLLRHHGPIPLRTPARYLKAKAVPSPPKISIVTPSLNQGRFLERTISSVLEQGYANLEYIVQDGGSQDGSVEVLKGCEDRLAHWESAPDTGQADAINRGMDRATGEIMAYLNSDDVLLPGALQYVARYFQRHPEVDVVYGHRVLLDQKDREIGRWVLPRHNDDVLSWADYVPQETLFWRRRIWEATGGTLEDFKFALDWDLLLRFRDAGANIVRAPRFLGGFRVHPAQKSQTMVEQGKEGAREIARIRRRELGHVPDREELGRGLRGYLRRHVVLHKLYRAHLLRY